MNITPQRLTLTYDCIPDRLDVLSPADLVVIQCGESLLQRVELSFVRDHRIIETEQVRWELTAHLAKPLETYVFAVQVFVRTEQEIKAMACLIERATIDAVRAVVAQHNPNIERIETIDGQFCFETNKIPLYRQKERCAKMLSLFTAVGSAASLILFLLGFVLLSFDQGVLSWAAAHQQELQMLEDKHQKFVVYQKKKEQAVRCQKETKTFLEQLKGITQKTPPTISFTALRYAEQRIEIEGSGDQSGLKKFSKAISATVDRSSGVSPLAFTLSLNQKVASAL
jgi:hypothetical protein